MSYTYAVLEISREAYEEITEKLNEAGYSEAFVDDLIDMHGIALKADLPTVPPPEFEC